jgi:hypothetical protein
MRRYTFVVHVHPEGVTTLENLGTDERVRIQELAEVGEQIERWMAAPLATPSGPGVGPATGGHEQQGAPG